MITVHTPSAGRLVAHQPEAGADFPPSMLWVDMVSPTVAEDAAMEAALGLEIPSRDDMAEIETSSRLYTENGAIFLTISLATGILRNKDELAAELHPLALILTPQALVTLRYTDITVIDRLGAQCSRAAPATPSALLVLLLDIIVDRLADSIERIAAEIDAINRQAFRRIMPKGRQQRLSNLALQSLLQRLGTAQDALSKARESAVSLARASSFLVLSLRKDANHSGQLKSMTRDLASLTDHASYLGNTITFLLDTTLGLINIEQNAVLKIFSVFAVVFLPPTMIAGIYGMNFERMPELGWQLGYPMALLLMLLSAILPYVIARWRGWL
ncbi:CorA family divalent cation transporter [Polymorphobacter multimanifer]|uniref:CorA family divalent cation transporter n=1 Tax=Polymorphobacter multimanifer TaxID=1070431 RepID=UPI00166DF4A7|nr:CorA family divalent cation transporter [Polymorphobacter multimanifer]